MAQPDLSHPFPAQLTQEQADALNKQHDGRDEWPEDTKKLSETHRGNTWLYGEEGIHASSQGAKEPVPFEGDE